MASDSDFMQKFFQQNPVPQEDIKHFTSIEWTNKHMQDPSYKVVPTFSRVLKPTGEDFYFARTLSTPITMPHYLTLQRRDFEAPPLTSPSSTKQTIPDHKHVTVVPEEPDCLCLISLGERGLDGHPHVMHGGVVSAILDETQGFMVMLHHQNVAGPGPRDLLFTANLNISYRAPIPTPGEILVKAWLTKRETKKWMSKAQIVDKHGKVLAEADTLWVISAQKL